jgi:hypothetical protein
VSGVAHRMARGWEGGWMDGRVDVWVDGLMDKWINGWLAGWMDGWMDPWRERAAPWSAVHGCRQSVLWRLTPLLVLPKFARLQLFLPTRRYTRMHQG